MKSQEEIQKAHDILIEIFDGKLPGVPAEIVPFLHAQANVLCWILEHDHNLQFTNVLRHLDELAHEHGLTLERMPDE